MNNKRKTICPFCKSDKIRDIVYGLLQFESEEKERKFWEENVMGGCEVELDSPAFHCDNCGKDFGTALSATEREKIKKKLQIPQKVQYNEKIRFDVGYPQVFEFPDFTLIPIGSYKARYIGLGGSKEYTSYRFKIKTNEGGKEISLDLSPERPVKHLSSPCLINGKLYIFETGKSATLGNLADDEFVVSPPKEK